MSYITHHGYGYSKPLCEDVASWFLNKFLPRHKIYVEVLHRGLKREGVCGWCDFVGEYYRPREFLIELDTHMKEEMYIKTLLHELVHLRQWVVGSLRQKRGKMYYGQECMEDYEYEQQLHEIEAREQEQILYCEYISQKKVCQSLNWYGSSPITQSKQYNTKVIHTDPMALSENTISKLCDALIQDVVEYISDDERFFDLMVDLIPDAINAKLGKVDEELVAELSICISQRLILKGV